MLTRFILRLQEKLCTYSDIEITLPQLRQERRRHTKCAFSSGRGKRAYG